jgi:diguanylate cyclase (GGDEF)-like protein
MNNPEQSRRDQENPLMEVIRRQQAVINSLARALMEERKAHAETRLRASRDPLIPTMLNKVETERLIEAHIEEGSRFGLFLIDFDHFKHVNDTLGHVAGDELLKRFGVLMNDSFRRETDKLAYLLNQGRVGGDEFMLLIDLSDPGGRRTAEWTVQMDRAYEEIKRISETLCDEYPAARALGFGVSVGGAWFDPDHVVTAKELRGRADEAMYEEKPEGSR